MTASENPPVLTTVDRLEGMYGLTGADLGLDGAAFTRRVALWEQLSAEQGGTPRQQQARVRVTALTNTITALMRRADKFRAEGDITTERDILGRVEVFQGWLTAAVAEADPTSPSSGGPRSANPAPDITGYGIGSDR